MLGNGAYALHEIGDLSGVAESVTLLTNGVEPNGDFSNIKIITDPIDSLTAKTGSAELNSKTVLA